jgi:hypothetical protein
MVLKVKICWWSPPAISGHIYAKTNGNKHLMVFKRITTSITTCSGSYQSASRVQTYAKTCGKFPAEEPQAESRHPLGLARNDQLQVLRQSPDNILNMRLQPLFHNVGDGQAVILALSQLVPDPVEQGITVSSTFQTRKLLPVR